MENKKVYEEGTVEITTTEYKDIIIEMVEHKKDAERYLREKYELREKLKATQEELFETQKQVVVLEARLADLSWAEHQSAKCEEMAKKTCLKKVLKYAPLKSDFVRDVTSDETIKSKLSEDMYEVSNEIIYEGEAVEVDDTVTAEE